MCRKFVVAASKKPPKVTVGGSTYQILHRMIERPLAAVTIKHEIQQRNF